MMEKIIGKILEKGESEIVEESSWLLFFPRVFKKWFI